MAAAKIVSGKEFYRLVKSGVSIVDFNAPWCGPCHAQEPIINRLAKRYEGRVLVAQMNIDNNQDVAATLGVRSIPTLTIFKDGKEVSRFVGLQSEDTLAAAMEKAL
jgi:thioredoxin 1